ncbi:hypothetical protein P4O66_009938, partial [Electrophorus voltai]
NLSLVEICSNAQDLFLTGSSSEDVTQNLLLAVLTKILCLITSTLPHQGSPLVELVAISIVQQANSGTKQRHTVGVAPYDPMKLLRIVPISYLSYEGSSDERLTQLCSKYEEIDAVETPSQVSLQFSQSSWSTKS